MESEEHLANVWIFLVVSSELHSRIKRMKKRFEMQTIPSTRTYRLRILFKEILAMNLTIEKRTLKREARACLQSRTPVSPFSRRLFIRTYQFVNSSTNFNKRGTTVYSRYA